MDLANTETNDFSLFNEVIRDDIINECQHCHQSYLAKYWDDELDWYIEINSTAFCCHCQDLSTK